MKSANRKTIEALVSERLAAIGAASIPTSARQLIEVDVWQACTRTVQRLVTAPRVGRAVARALAAPTAYEQGFEGGTPSTSSTPQRSWQAGVAGHTPTPQIDPMDSTDQLPTGELL